MPDSETDLIDLLNCDLDVEAAERTLEAAKEAVKAAKEALQLAIDRRAGQSRDIRETMPLFAQQRESVTFEQTA